jgi:hypothetical protein
VTDGILDDFIPFLSIGLGRSDTSLCTRVPRRCCDEDGIERVPFVRVDGRAGRRGIGILRSKSAVVAFLVVGDHGTISVGNDKEVGARRDPADGGARGVCNVAELVESAVAGTYRIYGEGRLSEGRK